MRTGLRQLLDTILDWKVRSTGYRLSILKQKDSTTNTTSMQMVGQPSLITMVYHTLTTLVLATMVQLCLVSITLITLSKSVIIVPLVVIAINALFILKTMHILRQLSAWWQAASKDARRVGQVNLTKTGGKAWSSREE